MTHAPQAAEPVGAAPRAHLEVRQVGPADFDAVYPLLQRFPTRRMTRDDWRYTLFTHPWNTLAPRGFALYANGRAVGFLGTVMSERPIAGHLDRVCNPSSWIVLEEYRYAALLLLRPVQRLRERTLVFLTPSPEAYNMFVMSGALPLESEQVVLLPYAGPIQALRDRGGSFSLSPEALRGELDENDRRIYEDHASSPVARHLLLRHGTRRCYVVATPARRRGIRYAEVQYASDRAFFWEHHLLARAALARAMGLSALLVAIDRRFLAGRPPPLSVRWPMRRLYRPSRPDISPTDIDGLYSELMGLRF